MPNNEERICIFKQNFDTNITEIEGPQYMTRAEAVERMAKAMCQTSGTGCTECTLKNKPRNCKNILLFSGIVNKAEAALDAILGGKNG